MPLLHRLDGSLVWRRLELLMTGSFLLVPHIQNLLAWYGLWLILITGEISKFFGILHICRLYCFAIQFHSDGKCRNLPTLHGVKTTYVLVFVAEWSLLIVMMKLF